jgi:uncharacterized alkaline shock family protein YloU
VLPTPVRSAQDTVDRERHGDVVQAEDGERQAAIDLDIVVEYGVAITDLARAIRRNVIGALERMTGLEVVEVNVSVNDVHLPSDDEGQEQAPPGPPRVT